MSSVYENHVTEVSAEIDMTSTGDKMTFSPAQPVNIVRWGVLANALIDVGAGMIIKADFRPTAGSDGSRGDGDVGDLTFSTDEDISQGEGAYTEECGTPAAGTVADPLIAQKFSVDPGEEVVFQITDAADTAGSGRIFVEYEALPFVGDSNATAGGFSNRIDNMTQNETIA